MAKKKPEKSLEQMLEEAIVKEDEQPYEVPGNWEWVKFDTVLLNVTSSQKKLKQKKYSGIGNIPVVDQGAKLIGGYTTQKDLQYDGKLPVIIFGDHTRIVKFIDFVFVQGADGVKVLLPRQIFVSEFIYYFLKNLYIPGMGYRRHFKFLRDAIFSLPPLLEQKRIVKKLSSMLGKLKEARELILEAKETFEERQAAIRNKAFTGELTKKWREENPDVESAEKGELQETPYNLPKSWSWVRLETLFHEVKEKVVPSLEINCAYIGLENLKTGGGLADIGKSNKVKSLKTVFRSGDVLYGKLRPYLNKHTKVDFDGITSTDILVFRTKGVLSEELLDMYLGVPRVVDYANRNSKGINLPRVSPKVMMRLLIPVPPPDEQKEIVRILDKLLDHEDEAKALIDMAEEIDLLEKSILSKAFRGELGTNDPKDEPAIELLKRNLKEKMNK